MQACHEIARSEAVFEALRGVVEPHLGVNVVDLGLVYAVHADSDEVRIVLVRLALQCQDDLELEAQVQRAVSERLPDLRCVEVEILRDRLWHPGRMSEETRRRLGL
jgi:metal-sulfur cluster biosynthetic enzyme